MKTYSLAEMHLKHHIIFVLITLLCVSCSDKQEVKPFRYTPPTPVDGKLKGIVELGTYGFNSFVIYMDRDKNWDLKNEEYRLNSIYESQDNQEILEQLKQYLSHLSEFGVSNKNIHFVVSSGAIKEKEVAKIIPVIKHLGYAVNIVSPEAEGRYALVSILLHAFKKESFVVDIGSGNTKISWLDDNEKILSIETYGAKYKQKGVCDDEAYKDVFTKVQIIPKSKRKLCFIMGGVPYAMAKENRKQKQRYTVLKPVNEYLFDDERLNSGLNIYNAIRTSTACERFVFDWNSNFSIGFLLSLKY